MFRPAAMAQLTSAFKLLKPKNAVVLGVATKKGYEEQEQIYKCSFKTYGGTEKLQNDLLVIEDTAVITCWYAPEITSDCRIKRLPDGAEFEILNEPENIEMRNFYMQFKVKRVKGGV